jgi:hypothetical protein
MKKLFFRRNCLFFVTLVIFLIGEFWALKLCVGLYGDKLFRREQVSALSSALAGKTAHLPPNHIEVERHMRIDISHYKGFMANNFSPMLHLAHVNDPNSMPPNHIALFFEISDYLVWAKESCDSMGVEFDPTCSFGFSNFFEKNEQPLASEIYDIHVQKEQLKLLLSNLFESRSSYLKLLSVERSSPLRSTYTKYDDVFRPDVETINGGRSYLYRLKFTAFTETFRNFLKLLSNNEVPVAIRQISIIPNYSFKLTKNSPDQLLECTASTFSITLEFLDIPQSLLAHNKKSAAILRKILYETAQ